MRNFVCLKINSKKANQISHRYNRLPLLPSGPGGVRQELVVSICRYKFTQNLKYEIDCWINMDWLLFFL